MNARTLPIHLLIPDPEQPRTDCADDDFNEIAVSVRDQGVLQDIMVEGPLPDGKYKIVFGERRYRAALKAELHEVPVRISEPLTDADRLEIQLSENLFRKDLSIRDRASAIARFVKYFPDQKTAATKLGMSEGRLSQLLELAGLRPEVSQLHDEKIVRDSSTLVMINQLLKRSPDEATAIIQKGRESGKLSRNEVATALAPHRKKHQKKSDSKANNAETHSTSSPASTTADSAINEEGLIGQNPRQEEVSAPQVGESNSDQFQSALPGFEEVAEDKLTKVKNVLKAPRNVASRTLIAQLVDAYLALLNQQSHFINAADKTAHTGDANG